MASSGVQEAWAGGAAMQGRTAGVGTCLWMSSPTRSRQGFEIRTMSHVARIWEWKGNGCVSNSVRPRISDTLEKRIIHDSYMTSEVGWRGLCFWQAPGRKATMPHAQMIGQWTKRRSLISSGPLSWYRWPRCDHLVSLPSKMPREPFSRSSLSGGPRDEGQGPNEQASLLRYSRVRRVAASRSAVT